MDEQVKLVLQDKFFKYYDHISSRYSKSLAEKKTLGHNYLKNILQTILLYSPGASWSLIICLSVN